MCLEEAQNVDPWNAALATPESDLNPRLWDLHGHLLPSTRQFPEQQLNLHLMTIWLLFLSGSGVIPGGIGLSVNNAQSYVTTICFCFFLF